MDLSLVRCCRALEQDRGNVQNVLLGKTPRYAPDRDFDTLHVRIELSVDFTACSITANCASQVRAFRSNLRELRFDAAGMRILSVRAFGHSLKFSHKQDKLSVRLPRPLAAGEEASLEIGYRISRPKTGLHFVRAGREHGPQLWSQGQPEDSHYWFPCHDAPHEKATSEVIVSVPKGFVAVSNGLLAARTRAGDRERFHWKMDRPHALYLVSFAVGRFVEVRDRWEDVPVLYYCEAGREQDARRGFAKTVSAIDFFSKKLGVRYPYPKYAQVAVAEFPGGMENTTCTTQTDACLIPKAAALDNDLDSLIAHELAHQWFGDLVTCRDWSHAWLNEGFATYCEILFTEHDKGRDEADYELYLSRQAYFQEDESRYRRPIVHNAYKYPWVLFDRHLYEKGACVLHMLRRQLGDDAWWRALKLYLNRFQDKSVETSDLIAAIEEASGRNLRSFFDQWVFRAGYPSYEISAVTDARRRVCEVRVLQKGSEPLHSVEATIRVTGPGSRWTRDFVRTIDEKEHAFSFKLPGPPALVEFDPDHILLRKVEFRKPFAQWVFQLRRSRSAISRIHAAKNVASWGSEEAVRILTASLRLEKFWGAAAEIAHALGSIRTDSAFRALKSSLKIRHPKARRAVVSALGGFARADAAPMLRALMRGDASLHVRAEAARALGALRDARHIPALRAQLNRRSYWDILAAGAVGGLAATRDAKALPALRSACRPPFGYPTRAHAVRALGQFAGLAEAVVPELCAMLEKALAQSDERIAMAVLAALSSAGDRRAIGPVKKAIEHPDSRVKTYAQEALARIRGDSEKEPSAKASKK